jgi:hypothetical protein
MDDTRQREGTPEPVWVRIGLLGIHRRTVAVAFMWASLALVMLGLNGFRDPRFFAFFAFLGSAAWYYLAIRWADQHGKW